MKASCHQPIMLFSHQPCEETK